MAYAQYASSTKAKLASQNHAPCFMKRANGKMERPTDAVARSPTPNHETASKKGTQTVNPRAEGTSAALVASTAHTAPALTSRQTLDLRNQSAVGDVLRFRVPRTAGRCEDKARRSTIVISEFQKRVRNRERIECIVGVSEAV
jgi:hypothetical protein